MYNTIIRAVIRNGDGNAVFLRLGILENNKEMICGQKKYNLGINLNGHVEKEKYLRMFLKEICKT